MVRRRRKPTRQSRARRVGQGSSMAAKAYRLARSVALTRPKPETKVFNTRATGFTIGNTGAAGAAPTYNICLPTPGTGDENNRIGDAIKLKNILIEGYFTSHASSTTSQYVLMYLVWDIRGNSISSVNDLFAPTDAGTAAAPFSHTDWDNRFQFKILRKKRFRLSPQGQVGDRQSFKIYLPVSRKKMYTNFDAGTTTVTHGALKLCFIAQDAANTPTGNYVSRVSYTDA